MTEPEHFPVWGTQTSARPELYPDARQLRVIVAAPSKAAAIRAFHAAGFRMSRGEFDRFGDETGNAEELSTAHSLPGRVFCQPLQGKRSSLWKLVPVEGS